MMKFPDLYDNNYVHHIENNMIAGSKVVAALPRVV